MFFSCGSPADLSLVRSVGINEALVSYFYLKKRKKHFVSLIEEMNSSGGMFMTDSGAFSFNQLVESPEATKEETWLAYLEEYVQFLHDYSDKIYVGANLDLDGLVGRDVVDKWNEKYFKPLEKKMNIVYVVQILREPGDINGMKRMQEYIDQHEYIGLNHAGKALSAKMWESIDKKKTRVHGFAWTSIPLLKSYPAFSVDSTTWLGGNRYGTSYRFDGKNFRVMDHKKKHYRKADYLLCERHGISMDKLINQDAKEVNRYNLIGWLGARELYLRSCRLKLKTGTVSSYDKTTRRYKK